LKAGVWFRRARLLIVSPDSRANLARRQAEIPLIALFRFPEPALFAEFMISWTNWNVIWLYHSTRHQENIPVRYRDMQALFWKCKSFTQNGKRSSLLYAVKHLYPIYLRRFSIHCGGI